MKRIRILRNPGSNLKVPKGVNAPDDFKKKLAEFKEGDVVNADTDVAEVLLKADPAIAEEVDASVPLTTDLHAVPPQPLKAVPAKPATPEDMGKNPHDPTSKK